MERIVSIFLATTALSYARAGNYLRGDKDSASGAMAKSESDSQVDWDDASCSTLNFGSDHKDFALSKASDCGYWDVLYSNEAYGSDNTDASYFIEASDSETWDVSGWPEGFGGDWLDALCCNEVSGSSHGCLTICPTDFEFVCGSDGVTYANVCAFRIAQCRTATLSLLAVGECAQGSEASSEESSESDSAAESCPDSCLDLYDPVSDENGEMYPNECYMRMAKCKDTNKDVDIFAEYKRLYGQSFGASLDDSAIDDSSDEKNAVEVSTKDDSSTQSTESYNLLNSSLATDGKSDLNEDGAESGSGSSSSITCTTCPDLYSPVCGSDGNTYLSLCELELASCINPKLKLIQTSEDFCADSSPEHVVLDEAPTSLNSATS